MSRERGNQMAKKNEEVNEETLDKETEKTGKRLNLKRKKSQTRKSLKKS